MNLSDKEKTQKTHEALKSFTDQFGPNDVYKEAFFDVLLEMIYGQATGNDLFVFGEEKQEWNATTLPCGEREMPSYEID